MQTALGKARIRNFRSVKEGPKVAAAVSCAGEAGSLIILQQTAQA